MTDEVVKMAVTCGEVSILRKEWQTDHRQSAPERLLAQFDFYEREVIPSLHAEIERLESEVKRLQGKVETPRTLSDIAEAQP
jgi:hypothetical protein